MYDGLLIFTFIASVTVYISLAGGANNNDESNNNMNMKRENMRHASFEYREAAEPRWRIGQIAELFGLSVQALRYYDQIGLFSPHERDQDTGYRYYLQTQVYRLANIVYLRKQGYSIKEIKDYLDNLTFKGRAAGLQMQAEALVKEVKRLEFISNTIKEKIHYIESSDYREKGSSIEVVSVPARSYLQIGPEKELYASEAFYFFPTIVIYTPTEKIFGACIRQKEDLLAYTPQSLEIELMEERLITIPARVAVRSFYKGRYETIREKLVEMMAYAQDRNIEIADCSIHFNIIDQFVESDPNQYITEIQIPLV